MRKMAAKRRGKATGATKHRPKAGRKARQEEPAKRNAKRVPIAPAQSTPTAKMTNRDQILVIEKQPVVIELIGLGASESLI